MNESQKAYLKQLHDLLWLACSWAGREHYWFSRDDLAEVYAVENGEKYTYDEIIAELERLGHE